MMVREGARALDLPQWTMGAAHIRVRVRAGVAEVGESGARTDLRQAASNTPHGIEIEIHVDARGESGDAGAALLTPARDVEADLLVMGAFGHGRTRERLMGGTTRSVLQSMTLPVLMAH
jgi:nucleotide-binding universal stress UspA family protein